jgi:predicted regulator of Ras-like GTPase activity (Roadblock/LC7/MglB family)
MRPSAGPRRYSRLCVAAAALTPELALDYLAELSTAVRAAVLLAPDGSIAAVRPDEESLGEVLRAAAGELLATGEQAGSAADGGPLNRVAELEVTVLAGSVFVVRRGGWTAGVVAAREALSSLMRYDLAMILDALAPGDEDGARATSSAATMSPARPVEHASAATAERSGRTGGTDPT